jgi:ketosteroid isomerase-like protein
MALSRITLGVSSALAKVVVPVLAAGLVIPAFAQEADQQTRQQIEAVQMKWVEAVNKGDVDALSTLYTPSTIGVDAFGRSMGINVELLQVVHKKGIALSAPIDGVQTLKGGQAAIAYGTFTTKYADPNMPPGQGNWVQVYERGDDGWKIRLYASSRSQLAAQIKK